MGKANGKTQKGFDMLKKMVEPEVEEAEVVDEVNADKHDEAQRQADIDHEKEVAYNLLMTKLLSVCNEAGTSADVCIAALISSAANVGDQTIKDSDALRNYMGHCYASTMAALEAHRGLGQGEAIQHGDDTGSEDQEKN